MIQITLEEWIAVTGALVAAFTPVYVILLRLERHVATVSTIIKNCPYCMRNKGDEILD